jgi:hypothetical protein
VRERERKGRGRGRGRRKGGEGWEKGEEGEEEQRRMKERRIEGGGREKGGEGGGERGSTYLVISPCPEGSVFGNSQGMISAARDRRNFLVLEDLDPLGVEDEGGGREEEAELAEAVGPQGVDGSVF